MTARYQYAGPTDELRRREILGEPLAQHHARALRKLEGRGPARWVVHLGEGLLFDAAGLTLIDDALDRYEGRAARLELHLAVDEAVFRDYYSLGAVFGAHVPLPVVAVREGVEGPTEILTLSLPASREPVPLPAGLAPPIDAGVPHALLMPYHGPFDMLFANQMALASELRRRIARSPWTWLKAAARHSGMKDRHQRLARAYREVHASAEVHPTAVLEGAVIGPRARVGAHCVVRYGVVAEGARLHDGAKVELSIVGAGTWLMHDLVLFRSVAEAGVFLIHGPYQFSYFQQGSGAFATILMDYRPDRRPIQVKTPSGLRPYGGAFLGAVVSEGAKTLGGSLLAPGRIVPPGTWLSADPASIHRLDDDPRPSPRTLSPVALRGRAE